MSAGLIPPISQPPIRWLGFISSKTDAEYIGAGAPALNELHQGDPGAQRFAVTYSVESFMTVCTGGVFQGTDERVLPLREKMFNPLIRGRYENIPWSIDLENFLILPALYFCEHEVQSLKY